MTKLFVTQEKKPFFKVFKLPGKKCIITTVSKENFEKKVTTTMVKLDMTNK